MAMLYFGNFENRRLRWGTVLFACAFVFVAVVGDLSCLTGQSHQQVDSAHNEIVFKFGEREFSKLELDKVRARHFSVVKFLEALEKKARQMSADDFYSGLPPVLRISPANSSTDNPDQIDSIVMDRVLFAEAAKRQGVMINDGVVNSYLDRLTGNKDFSEADMQAINRPINGERVGLDEIRDHMKIELAAKFYEIMVYSGVQATPNPTEAASIYKKLNQPIEGNVLPLAVSDYLSKVADKPTNEEMKEIFEEGKYRYSDRVYQRPGFKLASQFKIQYLCVEHIPIFKNEIKNVTDAEVKEEYDRLVLSKDPLVMELVKPDIEAVPPNIEAVPPNDEEVEKENLEFPQEPIEISPDFLRLNFEGLSEDSGPMRVIELDDSLSLAIRERIAINAALTTRRELIDDVLTAIQRGDDARALAQKLNLQFGETGLLPICELLNDDQFGAKVAILERKLPLDSFNGAADDLLAEIDSLPTLETTFGYQARYRQPFGEFIADRAGKLAIGETDRLEEAFTGDEYIWWLTEKEEPRVQTFKEAEKDVRAYWQFQKARELAVADAKKIAAVISSKNISLHESEFGKEGRCNATGYFTWMSDSSYHSPYGVESAGEDFMSTAFGLAPNEMGVALNAPENIVYVIQKSDDNLPERDFYTEFIADWKRRGGRWHHRDPVTSVMDRQFRDVISESVRHLADCNQGDLERQKIETPPASWENFSLSFESTLFDGRFSHLTDMAEQFPKPISSRWALLIAGDMNLREGLSSIGEDREGAIRKLDEAKRLYQQVVESKFIKTPMLQRRALFGLAYAMESLGEFDEAGKYYSQLIEEDSELADVAKRGLARTQDGELRAFFEVFTKTPTFEAPLLLPTRPNSDFLEPLPNDTLPETER